MYILFVLESNKGDLLGLLFYVMYIRYVFSISSSCHC